MIFIVLILVAAGFFVYWLVKERNVLLKAREDVNKAKSNVRIAKAKFLTTIRIANETDTAHMKRASEAIANATRNNEILFRSATGDLSGSLGTGSESLMKLSDNYSRALEALSSAICSYNTLVSQFPMIVAARILGFEREKTVDEENIDESTILRGFDNDQL